MADNSETEEKRRKNERETGVRVLWHTRPLYARKKWNRSQEGLEGKDRAQRRKRGHLTNSHGLEGRFCEWLAFWRSCFFNRYPRQRNPPSYPSRIVYECLFQREHPPLRMLPISTLSGTQRRTYI